LRTQTSLIPPSDDIASVANPVSAAELTAIIAARKIVEKVEKYNYQVILVGAGLSEVPAYIAYYLLRDKGIFIHPVMGHGYFGYEPLPGGYPSPASCLMLTDCFENYGVIVAGLKKTCLSLLGAGQIDKFGNTNSTKVGGRLLTGSGGSNDAMAAPETMVITRQSQSKFVEQAEYVTCAGDRVRTVVSDMGIFEKPEGLSELVLTGYVSGNGTKEDIIETIRDNCGWKLKVSEDAGHISPPTPRELELAFWLMPSRYTPTEKNNSFV
ncbi:MAG: hypothetical protein PHN78_08510, partial [Dehalococcoidales bacterium]|nr:hypothetical protein [Dehalococcoidales bacterium]